MQTYLSGKSLLCRHAPYESMLIYLLNSVTYASLSRGVLQSDCIYTTGDKLACKLVFSLTGNRYDLS